jgi:hypothetical protein
MKVVFLLAGFALVSQSVWASEDSKWDRLLLVHGYFGKEIKDFPDLTPSEKVMINSLGNLPYLYKTMVVIQENGEYYCFFHCFMEVYRWDGKKWAIYSDGKVSGYNCLTYEFFHNKEIYQFSGSGYWRSNSDLFLFGENRLVEFVRTANQPKDYFGSLKFKTDHGVFSIFGIVNYNKIPTFHFDTNGYFLDFKDWAWKKVKLEFTDQMVDLVGKDLFDQEIHYGGAVDAKDYALIEVSFTNGEKNGWLIIDKDNLEIYYKEVPKFIFQNIHWLQTKGNLIRFLRMESFESKTVDLSDQVKSAVLVGRVGVKEGPAFLDYFKEDWLPLLVEAIAVFVGLWLFWRWMMKDYSSQLVVQSEEEPDFTGQFSHWLKALVPYSGKLITQAQLEVILGVEGIENQDLRKVRRSRAIKALNEYMTEHIGKPIILRIRDDQDRRIIKYRIEEGYQLKSTKIPESMIK